MSNRGKNESTHGRERRVWSRRFRKQMRGVEQQAEAILAMNTDFHSRLERYREALLATAIMLAPLHG